MLDYRSDRGIPRHSSVYRNLPPPINPDLPSAKHLFVNNAGKFSKALQLFLCYNFQHGGCFDLKDLVLHFDIEANACWVHCNVLFISCICVGEKDQVIGDVKVIQLCREHPVDALPLLNCRCLLGNKKKKRDEMKPPSSCSQYKAIVSCWPCTTLLVIPSQGFLMKLEFFSGTPWCLSSRGGCL